MKKIFMIPGVLISCLCFCFYAPVMGEKISSSIVMTAQAKVTENTNTASDSDDVKNNELIKQTVEKWADAFCYRDGKALYRLFDPDNKDKFFHMEYVISSKDEPEISFGVSSPWPWETDYNINIEDNTAEITYYAMTSEPHVYTWIENLSLVKKDGLYYVASEKLKSYDSVTTKEELIQSISGYSGFYTNKLNYSNFGLSYTLNQNAVNNKTGIYADLFSAKTAAPYLLNLSGGKCTVKKKYLTCTIVTYSFKNGDKIDIRMIQPYGKKGIWLVEDVDVSDDGSIKKIESWYQKLSIKKLNKINKVVNSNELLQADMGSTLLLASIPKEKVYLYGYAGYNGVILRIKNKYQLFRWVYTSPRGILPKIGYADFDKDGKKEIAVSLRTGTGTGVSIDQLYLVKEQKDGTLSAMEFSQYQYINQLNERVSATYNQADETLQFFIDGKKAGDAIDFSSWIKEGYQYSDIIFGEQFLFKISKKTVTLNVTPGCHFKNVGSPQYDGMPSFTARVVFDKGAFSLSDIKVDK